MNSVEKYLKELEEFFYGDLPRVLNAKFLVNGKPAKLELHDNYGTKICSRVNWRFKRKTNG